VLSHDGQNSLGYLTRRVKPGERLKASFGMERDGGKSENLFKDISAICIRRGVKRGEEQCYPVCRRLLVRGYRKKGRPRNGGGKKENNMEKSQEKKHKRGSKIPMLGILKRSDDGVYSRGSKSRMWQ